MSTRTCASSDRVEAELLARKLACHRLHHPDPTGLLPGMQDDAAITIERLSMPVLRTQPSRGTSPGTLDLSIISATLFAFLSDTRRV
jgi:hypothetical protein